MNGANVSRELFVDSSTDSIKTGDQFCIISCNICRSAFETEMMGSAGLLEVLSSLNSITKPFGSQSSHTLILQKQDKSSVLL